MDSDDYLYEEAIGTLVQAAEEEDAQVTYDFFLRSDSPRQVIPRAARRKRTAIKAAPETRQKRRRAATERKPRKAAMRRMQPTQTRSIR